MVAILALRRRRGPVNTPNEKECIHIVRYVFKFGFVWPVKAHKVATFGGGSVPR